MTLITKVIEVQVCFGNLSVRSTDTGVLTVAQALFRHQKEQRTRSGPVGVAFIFTAEEKKANTPLEYITLGRNRCPDGKQSQGTKRDSTAAILGVV